MLGLDTSKTPSKMEMVKLSFDKDLREAATNVRLLHPLHSEQMS
jgi:hypothetical protein